MAGVGAILLSFAALGLQATLVPHLAVGGIRPHLPLIVVVWLGLRRGPVAGTLAGFCIGLGQDLTNPAFLGLNALAQALVGHAAGSVRESVDMGSRPIAAAVLAGAVLAHDLVYLAIFTRLALSEMVLAFVSRSLPTAVYTALVGAWVLAWLVPRRRRVALGRTQAARW